MARTSKTRPAKVAKKTGSSLQPARLDNEKFKQLYASILRCRMLTEQLRILKEQGRLERSLLPEKGQEAIEAAIVIDLWPDDRVAPGPYSVHTRLLRGETVRSIMGELLGGNPGSAKRTDPGVLGVIPSSFTLAAQLNLALGAAWAFRTSRQQHVAINFSREDSVSHDFWIDAVNFSVLNQLPVVHVVHSIHTDGSGAADAATLGANLSLPTLTVDGNDAVAVYRVGQEAVRRARQGRGPSLILCETSAWATATASKNHSQPLQTPADPIDKLDGYLRQKECWSEKWKQGIVSKFARELTRAVETAEKSRLRILKSDRTSRSVLASVG